MVDKLFAIAVGLMASFAFLTTVAGAETSTVEWKVLVYLDADNSLDVEAGIHHEDIVQIDLDELMRVGSGDYVDVFVLMDRYEDVASVWKVHKGSMELLECEGISGIEVDMGSPEVLETFVSLTESRSAATKTCLFFWDHGSPEGVAWDDNTGSDAEPNWLTHWEVVSALEDHGMDLIATDECMTGQMEVAWEYHVGLPQLSYAVLAECYTGWRGFLYDEILQGLSTQDVTPRELAEIIVSTTYVYFLDPPFMSELVTSHTAVDMYMLDGLKDSLAAFAAEMADVPDAVVHYAACQANILWGEKSTGFVDIQVFVEAIAESVSSQTVRDACTEVSSSLSAAVVGIADSHVSDDFQNGLGIWMPYQASESTDLYAEYAFSETGWLEFLESYWG
jgi:hypothetical protein